MSKVAVLMIVKDNYYPTRIVIENLLAKTDVPLSLYIFDMGSKDERMSKYAKFICEKTGGSYFNPDGVVSIPMAYNNRLLKAISWRGHDDTYECVFSANMLVGEHWLESLISAHENYYSENKTPVGIVGIRHTSSEPVLSTNWEKKITASEPTASLVWRPQNNVITGVMISSFGLMKFGEDIFIPGYEFDELCTRLSIKGHENFYVRGQFAIEIPKKYQCDALFPQKGPAAGAAFKEHVEALAKEVNKQEINNFTT